jgi:hypothetical protein
MTRSKPLTELRDADIRRVDAVKGAANGTRFIIAKSAAGAPEGLVTPDAVRELIADPPDRDQYIGKAGELVKAELSSDDRKDLSDNEFGFVDEQGVGHYPINDAAHVRNALSRAVAEIKAGGDAAALARKALPKIEAAARRMGIGEPAAAVKKERTVDPTTEEQAPPMSIEEARTILKRVKLEKKARKLEKRAALAKAAAEAGDKPKPQADPTAPDADGQEGDAGDGDAAADEVQKAAEPISLKKARSMAKAAKLAKRAALDQVATEKARRVLAKAGRRNSATDQAHIDGIDNHVAALGASAHQGDPRVSSPTLVTKSEGDEVAANPEQVASAVDVILKAVGPMLDKDRDRIEAQLTEVSQQLAKVSRIALPGGPRAVLDRDGSVIPAGDGEMGMTFEQAALAKIAQGYPVGSVEREAIEKAGAKSAIKDLMLARR